MPRSSTAATKRLGRAGDNIAPYVRANVTTEVRGRVEDGAHLIGEVFVDEGTVVEAGAYVRGPAIIGKHCEIRTGAYIRGDALVGDGCVVGNATELKNTLFLDRAMAPHYNYCGDSVLGNDVNLGAGTKLSNYKIAADKTVRLLTDDEPRRHGADQVRRDPGRRRGHGLQLRAESGHRARAQRPRLCLRRACAATFRTTRSSSSASRSTRRPCSSDGSRPGAGRGRSSRNALATTARLTPMSAAIAAHSDAGPSERQYDERRLYEQGRRHVLPDDRPASAASAAGSRPRHAR